MTTTEMSQGLHSERKSTKVMAPPGGGSSNIFGTDPEPARQVKNYQRSQIFGGGDDAQEQVKTGKKHGAHPADSNIFGNSDENKPTTARGKRKGDGAFNPITGEKYDTQNGEDEEEEKVKPSVKLYHPSGGASSGIFG